ncbi:Re/Si-specific NAD(P)(+) transhydrogenase subunit alpha [Alphaproteobacteria bacterium]|jgi:NAD(P) transhydrogenase subunit alpha|nr:Re/Si-specific NAD(P)(+) transhydrogenase subunit alpha [Alphaproteobacteria bacterium]MDB2583117.1 Re/Si-specific NAD(P)(+) transhydrogenase subunit alpha [Alphaproteobacteria bacterium]MDC6452143.1 Re/Si-specific NAD(P)(+) transhydrogenase subunit alpha [Alphaproteobacteria bacterium]
MIVGSPKEIFKGEARVAMTPESAKQIQKLGYTCLLETGAGLTSNFSDKDYKDAGVQIVKSASQLWKDSNIILKVRGPEKSEISKIQPNQHIISFIWPGQNKALLDSLSKKKVTVQAMDMIPRISRAQKMDALSSMANIAGYRAVIEAGNQFGRFFTGQITAAGKVPPAKILVIGAGVAGLAAIGTAQSMGAIVRAFDVRPEVAEQIESMGAEFLMLDFTSDGSGEGGYAKPASKEFIKKEMELFREQAPEIDIVITTALIPGMPAPKLWPKEMVDLMKPGSIVVDLAAEQGGNCEVTIPNKMVETKNKVKVIGYTDLPSRMATQSSNLYSTNIRHMLDDLTPEKNGVPFTNMDDDVIRGATVLHNGKITFPPPKPKVAAIAKHVEKTVQKTQEELDKEKIEAEKASGRNQIILLTIGAFLTWIIGLYAPSDFMQHFIVFILSCFVGYQVIWNVSHSLHTPLMAVTNAISSIIIIGALLQMKTDNDIVSILALISVFIATINIVGGFMVTKRMLAMFQRS